MLSYCILQRTKPKGLIDLGYGSVYMVHESLFNRPNCFQIVVRAMSDVEVFYLNAETPQLAQVRDQYKRQISFYYCTQIKISFILSFSSPFVQVFSKFNWSGIISYS